MATTAPIDDARLREFLGRMFDAPAGFVGATMMYIGDRLGLYRAMADGEPVDSAGLAARTGLAERYLRDWLINQAAGGIVEYDPATGRYRLPPEQAVALTDESSPACVAGAFQVLMAAVRATPRAIENIRRDGRPHACAEPDPQFASLE